MSYQAFVGIDISKKRIDACALVPRKDARYEKHFKNTPKGIKLMLKWLGKVAGLSPSQCLICMEHTGIYTLPLITQLSSAGLKFVVESPLRLKRSMGILRQKSDKADARSLASYAHLHQKRLKLYQMPGKALLKLRTLLKHRERLIKTRTRFTNACSELKSFAEPEIYQEVLEDWEDFKPKLNQRIKRIDQQMQALVKQEPELAENFKLLKSIPGAGPITAYNMLIYTCNFNAFESSRAFSCYAGTAPFDHSSGTSIRKGKRVSRIANRHVKTILHEAAWAAVRWDPSIKTYYNRLLEAGKPKLLAINNVKNKLLARMFAVIRRQTPYVVLQQ